MVSQSRKMTHHAGRMSQSLDKTIAAGIITVTSQANPMDLTARPFELEPRLRNNRILTQRICCSNFLVDLFSRMLRNLSSCCKFCADKHSQMAGGGYMENQLAVRLWIDSPIGSHDAPGKRHVSSLHNLWFKNRPICSQAFQASEAIPNRAEYFSSSNTKWLLSGFSAISWIPMVFFSKQLVSIFIHSGHKQT